jgi:hypothetical protein
MMLRWVSDRGRKEVGVLVIECSQMNDIIKTAFVRNTAMICGIIVTTFYC